MPDSKPDTTHATTAALHREVSLQKCRTGEVSLKDYLDHRIECLRDSLDQQLHCQEETTIEKFAARDLALKMFSESSTKDRDLLHLVVQQREAAIRETLDRAIAGVEKSAAMALTAVRQSAETALTTNDRAAAKTELSTTSRIESLDRITGQRLDVVQSSVHALETRMNLIAGEALGSKAKSEGFGMIIMTIISAASVIVAVLALLLKR